MNNKTLVSVIMIFLNAGKFIEEAIESVLSQTHTDWELLLVGDGSTDTSIEIGLRYARAHPERVRYLQHEGHRNYGMSASRNFGISSARGEMVAFLDADDVWLPDKLKEQIAILESQPNAAMVYGPIELWYSWTGRAKDLTRDFIPELNIEADTLIKPPRLLTAALRSQGVTTTNALLRRKIFGEVGLFEESFTGMFEDQVFHAKVCLHAPVYLSSKCWYRWRKHEGSACAVAIRKGEYGSARLNYLRWLGSYLTERRINDGELLAALHKELFHCRHPALHTLANHIRHHELVLQENLKGWARRALPGASYHWLRNQRNRFTGRKRHDRLS